MNINKIGSELPISNSSNIRASQESSVIEASDNTCSQVCDGIMDCCLSIFSFCQRSNPEDVRPLLGNATADTYNRYVLNVTNTPAEIEGPARNVVTTTISSPFNLPTQFELLLSDEITSELTSFSRPLEGGCGGQTVFTDSFALKMPGQIIEANSAFILKALGESTPQTVVLNDTKVIEEFNTTIPQQLNCRQIRDNESLLVTPLIPGENLADFLKAATYVDRKFICREMGRIAVKDLLTGNKDRIICIESGTNGTQLNPYINFGNILVVKDDLNRVEGERMVLIDSKVDLTNNLIEEYLLGLLEIDTLIDDIKDIVSESLLFFESERNTYLPIIESGIRNGIKELIDMKDQLLNNLPGYNTDEVGQLQVNISIIEGLGE